MILATLGAFALLLGALLYQRCKIAGEEVVRIEIHYHPPAPLGIPSNKLFLKYRASNVKATRIWQQIQVGVKGRKLAHPSFWMSDFHSVKVTKRNGLMLHTYLDIVSNRVWPWDYKNGTFDGREGNLTPESLHYFRALLAPKTLKVPSTTAAPR